MTHFHSVSYSHIMHLRPVQKNHLPAGFVFGGKHGMPQTGQHTLTLILRAPLLFDLVRIGVTPHVFVFSLLTLHPLQVDTFAVAITVSCEDEYRISVIVFVKKNKINLKWLKIYVHLSSGN